MTELAIRDEGSLALVDGSRTMRLVEWAQEAHAANQLAKSLCKTPFAGQFKGDEYGATAAILRGAEMGLTPVTSLGAFDLIQGQPAPKALTLRALVQSQGHSVWIERSTDTECIAKARRRGEAIDHESKWTILRAQKLNLTGKDNWKKQPQAMLVARATAEVCRMIAADVLLGIAYASEELLDAEPEQTVAVKRSTTTRVQRAQPAPVEPSLDPDAPIDLVPAEPDAEPDATPVPDDEHDPRDMPATRSQITKLNIQLQEAGITDRAEKLAYLSGNVGRDLESSKDLTKAEASALIDALEQEAQAERDADQGEEPAWLPGEEPTL